MLHCELVSQITPKYYDKARDIGVQSHEYQLLSWCMITPSSHHTVLYWVQWMGFAFACDRTKKSYYVDGHEKPEQVSQCSKFITEVLASTNAIFDQ